MPQADTNLSKSILHHTFKLGFFLALILIFTGLYAIFQNITITILNIMHCPVFYLERNVSKTEFYPRLQVEYTQLDPVDRASLVSGHQQNAVSEMLCFK
jgi:hypothetical protein